MGRKEQAGAVSKFDLFLVLIYHLGSLLRESNIDGLSLLSHLLLYEISWLRNKASLKKMFMIFWVNLKKLSGL
ncbi:hypothetical protein C6H64_05330 [Photorhabdus luminescens]|nr:hypothetical protein C6H64_05330 [Photorhabdus luminescens]